MQINSDNQNKICVVTVFYKAEKHIEKFLASLERNIESVSKMVIIDNNSNDQALNIAKNWCQKNNLELEFKINTKNLGYTAAANMGIKLAERDHHFILLTNNDLHLEKNALSAILNDAIDSESDVMGVPGKVSDEEVFLGFNHKESYLKLTNFIKIKKTYLDFLIKHKTHYFPCDFPSGLILLFSKSFFQKLGYFDEELFFSGDETDFAIRVNKNKNIKSFVSLSAYDLVDHVSFGTSGNSLIKNKNYVRGYIYILLKHTDKIFSIRYWARLFYFVGTIIYERPSYTPFLIYHAILSTFEFRKIYKYK